MGIQQRCKEWWWRDDQVHRAQHHHPHQTIRADSCDQNNGIINGGRGCLQFVSDDAGGTITLTTWYRLALWNPGRFTNLKFNVVEPGNLGT